MKLTSLLHQPEVQSLLTLLLSIIILIFSAYSILVPYCLWACVSANYLYTLLYASFTCLIMRWIARGGQYVDINKANISGQTFIITGAAAGIGKETANELAKRGARVILLTRRTNLSKTISDVQKYTQKPANVVGYVCDLSDLKSIQSCVDEFFKNEDPNMKITALINNAGVMGNPYSKTKDGFELQMGTNHFGHFYLTKLLLPRLQSSRIVNVSSTAHAFWQVPCDAAHYALLCNTNTYNAWKAYSLSKSANILFTRELQRRYSEPYKIRAYALHPGGVNTKLDRHMKLHSIVRMIATLVKYLILKTPFEGAQTNLYCALSDNAVPGAYHADCARKQVANKYVEDDNIAREWWEYSERALQEKLDNH